MNHEQTTVVDTGSSPTSIIGSQQNDPSTKSLNDVLGSDAIEDVLKLVFNDDADKKEQNININYFYDRYDLLMNGYLRINAINKYNIYIANDIIKIIYAYYPQHIQVAVRFQPISKQELTRYKVNGWDKTALCPIYVNKNHLFEYENKNDLQKVVKQVTCMATQNLKNSHTFTFDDVLIWVNQQTLFNKIGVPLVDSVLNGINATLIVYGQTGSGKKYSMFGDDNDTNSIGIIYRSLRLLFKSLSNDTNIKQYTINISCVEMYIYNQLRDLLHPSKKGDPPLRVRDGPNGVFVQHLKSKTVSNYDEALSTIKIANMNANPSWTHMSRFMVRTHHFVVITVNSEKQNGSKIKSKLMFAICAGSEKVRKQRRCTASQLREASAISQSLSSFGKIVSVLASISTKKTKKKMFVPFRDSAFTHILKESFGSNCKTIILCTLSPHQSHLIETLSTLRFASRCQVIQTNLEIENNTCFLN